MNSDTLVIDRIFAAVARSTGVGRYWIRGQNRQPAIVYARALAVLAMRGIGMSWPAIGEALNREHSTVLELADAYRGQADVEADLAELLRVWAPGAPGVSENSPRGILHDGDRYAATQQVPVGGLTYGPDGQARQQAGCITYTTRESHGTGHHAHAR